MNDLTWKIGWTRVQFPPAPLKKIEVTNDYRILIIRNIITDNFKLDASDGWIICSGKKR